MVKEVDISIIDLDVSEIQKCDGALTSSASYSSPAAAGAN